MKIEHIAIWTQNLELMKDFYIRFFKMTSNEKYFNSEKQFSSYFLSFHTGARIELMHRPDIAGFLNKPEEQFGMTHFAVSVGSKTEVNRLTDELRTNGYKIFGEPRTTGDGYYESVVADPEGNRIEITE